MAENLCVKMGGGVQKWDLLWENPSPTSNFSSNVTITVDTTQYEHIFVLVKQDKNATSKTLLMELDKRTITENTYTCFGVFSVNTSGSSTSSDRVSYWRYYRIYEDRIIIYGGSGQSGYIYVRSGGKDVRQDDTIPLAVYGVKKLKLGD